MSCQLARHPLTLARKGAPCDATVSWVGERTREGRAGQGSSAAEERSDGDAAKGQRESTHSCNSRVVQYRGLTLHLCPLLHPPPPLSLVTVHSPVYLSLRDLPPPAFAFAGSAQSPPSPLTRPFEKTHPALVVSVCSFPTAGHPLSSTPIHSRLFSWTSLFTRTHHTTPHHTHGHGCRYRDHNRCQHHPSRGRRHASPRNSRESEHAPHVLSPSLAPSWPSLLTTTNRPPMSAGRVGRVLLLIIRRGQGSSIVYPEVAVSKHSLTPFLLSFIVVHRLDMHRTPLPPGPTYLLLFLLLLRCCLLNAPSHQPPHPGRDRSCYRDGRQGSASRRVDSRVAAQARRGSTCSSDHHPRPRGNHRDLDRDPSRDKGQSRRGGCKGGGCPSRCQGRDRGTVKD